MSEQSPSTVPSVTCLRTVIAHDVDEHAHNLTNWEQSYDQVAAGRFDGMLEEWRADGLQIFRERSSHAVRQSCCVWPDAYWFGIEPQRSGMRINGRQPGTNAIMTRPGNREFELVTPDNHQILGIVIQRNTLLEAASRHGCTIGWGALAETEVLQVSAEALQACAYHIATLLQDHGNDTQEDPDQLRQTITQQERHQEQVIAALLSMLDRSSADHEACGSFIRRRRIVNDARDYAMHNQAQAVTVPMLCAHLHVSRRTLQYCFEDVLGMSPMTYLRSLRLNGVRRQLRDRTSTDQRIGDVAAAWGFTNFSQFSCDYKKLFGATPSAALRAVG
jgi:AraC family transcriptional regulator, ethanolamine operon transcriptional activator